MDLGALESGSERERPGTCMGTMLVATAMERTLAPASGSPMTQGSGWRPSFRLQTADCITVGARQPQRKPFADPTETATNPKGALCLQLHFHYFTSKYAQNIIRWLRNFQYEFLSSKETEESTLDILLDIAPMENNKMSQQVVRNKNVLLELQGTKNT